jgi:hypothetical protein
MCATCGRYLASSCGSGPSTDEHKCDMRLTDSLTPPWVSPKGMSWLVM